MKDQFWNYQFWNLQRCLNLETQYFRIYNVFLQIWKTNFGIYNVLFRIWKTLLEFTPFSKFGKPILEFTTSFSEFGKQFWNLHRFPNLENQFWNLQRFPNLENQFWNLQRYFPNLENNFGIYNVIFKFGKKGHVPNSKQHCTVFSNF